MQTNVKWAKWAYVVIIAVCAVLLVSGRPDGLPPALAPVLSGCRYLALAGGGWLSLVAFLSVASRLPGVVGRVAGLLRDRITPRFVRRALGLGVGLGLAASSGTAWALPPSSADGTVLGPPPFVAGLDWPTGGPVPMVSAPPMAPAATAAPPRAVLDWPATGPMSVFPAPSPVDSGVVAAPAIGAPLGSGPADSSPVRPPPPVARAMPRLVTGRAGRAEPVHSPGRAGSPSPAARLSMAPVDPSPPRSRAGEVVVRPGDTLWGITARWLGARATEAGVAAQWPRWYATNRAVIGPDPNLIVPGERLSPPAAD